RACAVRGCRQHAPEGRPSPRDCFAALARLRAQQGAPELVIEVHETAVMEVQRMRDLAMILRKRRFKRGALELHMPEAELEYDNEGRVSGAHFAEHDISHQVIEEFMLAANQAVATWLDDQELAFLHRIHAPPDRRKLTQQPLPPRASRFDLPQASR
ncbi:MAG: RNB domain-containing ribonuclease, partial [Verrucomicrobiae bacterium]|nr:RNB domain-containing ribonuclease [Verrucomicrobiae bacterium]